MGHDGSLEQWSRLPASGDSGLLKWAGVVSDSGNSGQEKEDAEVTR